MNEITIATSNPAKLEEILKKYQLTELFYVLDTKKDREPFIKKFFDDRRDSGHTAEQKEGSDEVDKQFLLEHAATKIKTPSSLKKIISELETQQKLSKSDKIFKEKEDYYLNIQVDKDQQDIQVFLQWPPSYKQSLNITPLLSRRERLYIALVLEASASKDVKGTTNGLISADLLKLIQAYCPGDNINSLIKKNTTLEEVTTRLKNMDNFSIIQNFKDNISQQKLEEKYEVTTTRNYYTNGQENSLMSRHESLCNKVQGLEQLMNASTKQDDFFTTSTIDFGAEGIEATNNGYMGCFHDSLDVLKELSDFREKEGNKLQKKFYEFEYFVISLLSCVYGPVKFSDINNDCKSTDNFFYSAKTHDAICNPGLTSEKRIDLWSWIDDSRCTKLEKGIYLKFYNFLGKNLKQEEGKSIQNKIKETHGEAILDKDLLKGVKRQDERLGKALKKVGGSTSTVNDNHQGSAINKNRWESLIHFSFPERKTYGDDTEKKHKAPDNKNVRIIPVNELIEGKKALVDTNIKKEKHISSLSNDERNDIIKYLQSHLNGMSSTLKFDMTPAFYTFHNHLIQSENSLKQSTFETATLQNFLNTLPLETLRNTKEVCEQNKDEYDKHYQEWMTMIKDDERVIKTLSTQLKEEMTNDNKIEDYLKKVTIKSKEIIDIANCQKSDFLIDAIQQAINSKNVNSGKEDIHRKQDLGDSEATDDNRAPNCNETFCTNLLDLADDYEAIDLEYTTLQGLNYNKLDQWQKNIRREDPEIFSKQFRQTTTINFKNLEDCEFDLKNIIILLKLFPSCKKVNLIFNKKPMASVNSESIEHTLQNYDGDDGHMVTHLIYINVTITILNQSHTQEEKKSSDRNEQKGHSKNTANNTSRKIKFFLFVVSWLLTPSGIGALIGNHQKLPQHCLDIPSFDKLTNVQRSTVIFASFALITLVALGIWLGGCRIINKTDNEYWQFIGKLFILSGIAFGLGAALGSVDQLSLPHAKHLNSILSGGVYGASAVAGLWVLGLLTTKVFMPCVSRCCSNDANTGRDKLIVVRNFN